MSLKETTIKSTSVELISAEVVSPPNKKYLFPYWSNKDNRHLIVTIENSAGQQNMAYVTFSEVPEAPPKIPRPLMHPLAG